MAIEFRCTQCQKLLRVADETAGKQAKCPSCGAVLMIPAAAEPGPAAGLSANPFGDLSPAASPSPGTGGAAFAGGPGETVNPYQSPLASIAPPPSTPFAGPRTGPAWERDGASFQSFMATVKGALFASRGFCDEMRREGGLGPPLWFAVIGGTAGTLVALLFNTALQGLVAAAAGGEQLGAALGGMAVGLVCSVVILPLVMIINGFIWSGIYHLMLMLLKGANLPFETTYRVTAYAVGVGQFLNIIPIVGGIVGFVVMIVLSIYGLKSAQEVSGGKAAGAVLGAYAVCCVGLGTVYALIIGLFFAVAGAQ